MNELVPFWICIRRRFTLFVTPWCCMLATQATLTLLHLCSSLFALLVHEWTSTILNSTMHKLTPLHLCSSLFALLTEHCQACWSRWCSVQRFTGTVLHLSSGICCYVHRTHPNTRPKNGKPPLCCTMFWPLKRLKQPLICLYRPLSRDKGPHKRPDVVQQRGG